MESFQIKQKQDYQIVFQVLCNILGLLWSSENVGTMILQHMSCVVFVAELSLPKSKTDNVMESVTICTDFLVSSRRFV